LCGCTGFIADTDANSHAYRKANANSSSQHNAEDTAHSAASPVETHYRLVLPQPAIVLFMQEDKITGGCYCGEVRFSATPGVRVSTNCHCANCRRAAGAQAVAWIVVKRAQFKFVKGQPHRYRTDTGAWRTFCDQCGTSLTYETDRRPDEIDITTGSLDHPEDFPPTKDVYPEERLPWVDLIHA
jgi:hypothetical protein